LCDNITLADGYCGDGVLQSSHEQCDDANSNNLDSCRNNCKLPYCGDGIKDTGEQCDDGNNVGGDGCSSTCKKLIIGCPPGTICGNITTEEFPPIVWQCGDRIMTDENVQPWRFSYENDFLYERAGNYLFEGEKFTVDVVVFDKNKIQDVVVDLILDSSPESVERAEDAEYSVNCVEAEVNFTNCNARIGEEKITRFDRYTMQGYECSITILDSEHMYGDYWLTVLADDKINSGVYNEMTPLWLNPFISLNIDGGLFFENTRPGTSSYTQVSITNEAEGGVALDMFITGERWYPSGGKLGRCMGIDGYGQETGVLQNYISLGAIRYYAENGAFTTRYDEEVDNQDYYSGLTRDVDSEGYVNLNPQLNEGFQESMFDEAEIIQAGGSAVEKNGKEYGYRANVLNSGSRMALTLRLDYPEPCYGNFDAGKIYLWGEAI
jgi:cysteine-rich repeat protein